MVTTRFFFFCLARNVYNSHPETNKPPKNTDLFCTFIVQERCFCYSIAVSSPLPIPHLPPSLYFSHFCTPVKCFVCCDFPCGYLSGDSMPHPGTGPQFPRQLYNCFGCVPNATGYRGIIDVKRNMYEMRRCGGVHMVLYTASCKAIYPFFNGSFVISLNRSHMCRMIFHNFDLPVSQRNNSTQCNPLNCAVFTPFMSLSHCRSMHNWVEFGDLTEYNMSITMLIFFFKI